MLGKRMVGAAIDHRRAGDHQSTVQAHGPDRLDEVMGAEHVEGKRVLRLIPGPTGLRRACAMINHAGAHLLDCSTNGFPVEDVNVHPPDIIIVAGKGRPMCVRPADDRPLVGPEQTDEMAARKTCRTGDKDVL
jgi:hypothetical protein